MNTPKYTISPKAIDLVARIAEKVGEIKGSGEYGKNLRLRKVNRLRSIQSSLAIENNPLSLGQVIDIIEGKNVLGLPHEIQEVKNAYSAYEHFEIEFIHPFMDGNGRIGRLWQTLILSKWNELFAWLPVETVVYENQQGYYDALEKSQKAGDSECFIEFMLDAILQALEELPIRKITDIFTDINTDKLSKTELEFLEQIAGYLDKNNEITNYRAQLLTNKSDISVKKYFAKFVELGLLSVEGKNKGRKYLKNRK